MLLLYSPNTSKIPSPKSNRLPSNIPLRTLTNRSDHGTQSTSLLAGHRDQPSHERLSSDSADSDSWTDTGDLAEQLADAEDPLRKTIADTSLNQDLFPGVLKRHPNRKRVQFRRSVSEHSHRRSRSSRSLPGGIDKEAIEIPIVPPRRISRAERILASIMPGAGIHGFTGKALMCV